MNEKNDAFALFNILIAAGLILTLIGGFKIINNLPVSEQRAVKEARQKMANERDVFGNPMNRSLMGISKINRVKAEVNAINRERESRREEASYYFIPGVVVLVAGISLRKQNTKTVSRD